MKKVIKIKRLFSVVISVVLMLSLMSFQQSPFKNISVRALESGDYTYIILEDGTAEITEYYNQKTTSAVIPETLGGYKVTSIAEEAFTWGRSTELRAVTIPSGVVSIAPKAFSPDIKK